MHRRSLGLDHLLTFSSPEFLVRGFRNGCVGQRPETTHMRQLHADTDGLKQNSCIKSFHITANLGVVELNPRHCHTSLCTISHDPKDPLTYS